MSRLPSAWMRSYLKSLVGRKITGVGVGKDDFPYFILDNGWKCEISKDPEGNGPGFLFGLPDPKEDN